MRKLCVLAAWTVPLAIHSGDALAWGLYTHVYFAQLLIWAVPLAEPRFRRAVQRLPELMLAGACLPDAALFSRCPGARALGMTHQWPVLRRMLENANDDESRALTAGYASHLLADIIALNHFVPEHERLWLNCPVITHAVSEWAMDAHLAPQLFAFPEELLRRHGTRLARQAAAHLDCSAEAAQRALHWLANGERFLRSTGVPHALRRCAAKLDARIGSRFDHYVSQTARRLCQINRLIAGDMPAWNAEPDRPHAAGETQQSLARGLTQRLLLPQDLF